MTQPGRLYVVATPIGNLADFSDRAREVLASVDLIACEDTRHSRPLLHHFGIDRPLMSLHDHNEDQASARVLERLRQGDSVALISDAGTPLVSDPGFVLVRAVRAAGMDVTPIPGPSALICALSAAGLPSDRFLFVGFPPRTAAARQDWARALSAEPGTLICYESGRRVVATLEALYAELGARQAVVARELTKRYETFLQDRLPALAERIAEDPDQQRGEFVIMVEGDHRDADQRDGVEQDRLLSLLLEELPLKKAVSLAARISGGSRNHLYQRALVLRDVES